MKKKTVKLSAEAMQLLEQQRQAFREKFGCDPGPDDPVFFDPDCDTPQPMSEVKYCSSVVGAMQKAGIAPTHIYAYLKTGMIITTVNQDLFSDDDIEEWRQAIQEYRALELQPFDS